MDIKTAIAVLERAEKSLEFVVDQLDDLEEFEVRIRSGEATVTASRVDGKDEDQQVFIEQKGHDHAPPRDHLSRSRPVRGL